MNLYLNKGSVKREEEQNVVAGGTAYGCRISVWECYKCRAE